jgi:hypothetical protein
MRINIAILVKYILGQKKTQSSFSGKEKRRFDQIGLKSLRILDKQGEHI